MPPEIKPGSAREWLERAKGKLALARQPLPEGGYWEDLCYMAQQAAELSLTRIFHQILLRLRILRHLSHFACPPTSTCPDTLSAGGLRKMADLT